MRKEKLKKALTQYYKTDMVKSILCGRAMPSLKNVIKMKKNNNIPYSAWEDIRSYINNDNQNKHTTTSLQRKHL